MNSLVLEFEDIDKKNYGGWGQRREPGGTFQH